MADETFNKVILSGSPKKYIDMNKLKNKLKSRNIRIKMGASM